MRGRFTAGTTLAALLTALTLSGCAPALPAEVDARLVDDWTPLAAVGDWTPKVGECLVGASVDIALRTAPVVDCAEPHIAEVVYVGKFPGDAYPGPRQKADALAKCDVEAMLYLDRAWGHASRLELRLATPKVPTWESGARWFRCEISEQQDSDDSNSFVTRKGSLKGAIPAALLVNCVNASYSGDDITLMTDMACNRAHNAEYVGVFRDSATAAYPVTQKVWDRLHRTCGTLVTQYLGVGVSRAPYYGTIVSLPSQERWEGGDHAVLCAISFGKKTMRKSVAGGKGRGIPS
ncbi:septum formation family protein [Catellatospora vulcania]|uniref:septum formation family protein n=1 Tax=Catellatospora vulcania TaxID=1460450 RepID=UPI0012D4B09D|nr:septum formation family protein [Catellatospora vulcania]